MTDVLSNWMANTFLEQVPAGCYLAAHLSQPSPAGDTGTEVAGGGYVRQPINFGPVSNRTIVSINAQTFPGMPDCYVLYLAVWTAIGAGHLVYAKALPSPIHVLASGQLLVAKGDVAMSV